ncbi:glycosyltransferase [Blastococcus sp. SYSU DS0533]
MRHARPRHRAPAGRQARLALIRVLVVLTLVTGVNYVAWRWLFSVNWDNWWIAVPLVLAETYSLIDAFLFGATMWRWRQRGEPDAPPPDATVDVFITTYNEPLDLVMTTARAADAIRFPHRTWVLDDGDRADLRAAALEAGIGYITRSADWAERPRHAKAGNLNNALFTTDGEFLLILDADQVPDPAILDRTLGYFRDPQVALVQTPQWFVNVDEADPLGSQAPLFYGPIQQGKDGWNAAFFCGSNAVLRREALMQLGVVGYVREVERAVASALRTAQDVIARARQEARDQAPAVLAALDDVAAAVREARGALRAGEPVSEITYRFQRRVDAAGQGVVAADVAALQDDLAAIRTLPVEPDSELGAVVIDEVALRRLAQRDWSPLGALESVKALVDAVDVGLGHEAQPVMPLATISVTEDMATAMRLHALGWRTVYHHEVLARGLAPEDLGTMLQQRLRWSQGTLQVMLRENPLVQRGLSAGQRLMYLATMWSYLSGFAAVVYIAAPVLYLFFGIRPVESFGGDFLIRLAPYLLATQLLFLVVGYGIRTWRGQQYSLALFPLWIRACTTAVGNVVFGRSLGFVVTPKTRQESSGFPWRLVLPQLITIGLLVTALVVGLVRLALGLAPTAVGTWVNVVWVLYDLVVLSVIIQAGRYRGPAANEEAGT